MELEKTILREHDYSSHQSSSGPLSNIGSERRAAGLELSVMASTDPISSFQGELHGRQVLDLSLTGPLLERWCMSDGDFRYFTGFPSKYMFTAFWTSIEPSASRIVYWSNANRTGIVSEEESITDSSPQRKLPLIDEFFMFCLHLTLGQKEKTLAQTFGVSASRVSQILAKWTDYLYLLLGSIQFWMTPLSTIPVKVPRYCQNVRVIIASTELTCENPQTKAICPEKPSARRSCTTFKALIGVAPCGSITFVSKLFPGSFSNNETTLLSGILELLDAGDQLIAGKDFNIEGLLTEIGVKLLTFPLKHDSNCTKSTQEARAVARLHALAESAIDRIKENQILNSPIQLCLAGTVNKIWSCCCMMVNFQCSLDSVGS